MEPQALLRPRNPLCSLDTGLLCSPRSSLNGSGSDCRATLYRSSKDMLWCHDVSYTVANRDTRSNREGSKNECSCGQIGPKTVTSPNHLREIRTARGLTLDAVAERAGTDRSTLAKLETGKRRLSLDWIYRLAIAFGVTPEEIVAGPASPAIDGRIGPGGTRVAAGVEGALIPPGASAPVGPELLKALVVEDGFATPFLRAGDVVFYADRAIPIEQLIGAEVIATLSNNSRLHCYLISQVTEGTFQIKLADGRDDEVVISTANPVRWIRRSLQDTNSARIGMEKIANLARAYSGPERNTPEILEAFRQIQSELERHLNKPSIKNR